MTAREIVKVALNLVVIYAVGGFLLAGVYSVTSPIIFKNNKEAKEKALKLMMPQVGVTMKVPEKATDKVSALIPEGAAQKTAEAEKGTPVLEIEIRNSGVEALMKRLKKAGAKKIRLTPLDAYRSEKIGDWESQHKHVEYYAAYKGEEPVGHIVETYGKGYSSYIHMLVSVDEALVVMKISILGHAETPGLGDEIEPESFRGQFEGKDLEHLVLVKGETEDKIQAITGATISSRAVTAGVRDAVRMITDKLKEKNGETDGNAEQPATH